jgi:hypothetical protein
VSASPVPDEGPLEIIETTETTWRFDRAFLQSPWMCIWGRGCQGIHAEPSEHLQQGCCSVGAELDGDDEAMNLAALAATLSPDRFQHHAEAAAGGIFRDDQRRSTRVVNGACIFLNRPGFSGGAGCALHLAAQDCGESPIDWKPSVCWQLPIKVEWADRGDGGEIATVRRWKRSDWGDDEADMAWWCTEAPEAYGASAPVIDTLASELSAILHDPVSHDAVFVELRRRLSTDSTRPTD